MTEAFATQARYNYPGMSPPMNTEFYTGWLTHWGENVANTSAQAVEESIAELLNYPANFNLYMVGFVIEVYLKPDWQVLGSER